MKIPVFRNTITNYLSAGVKMLEGIVISRWIIEYLGMDRYGLWTLFWSFFVYALLFDFGGGATAQKYTANGLYEKDPVKYGKTLSAIFTFHCLMGIVIAAATFLGLTLLPQILNCRDPLELRYAGHCFMMFGLGAALLFPMGIFPEILVGLQKLYLRNNILIISKLAELAGTLILFILGGGLLPMIAMVFGIMLLSNLAMAWCVRKQLPHAGIGLTADFSAWKETVSFSGFVFLCSFARMILNKSSRLLISIFCGVASVGIFQISSKLADLCAQMVGQYQENTGPISGALYGRGKFRILGRIILGSMRWNSFLAFGGMVIAGVLAEPLLKVLFRIDRQPEIIFLSRLFLFSMYLSLVVRNIPHRFFLMTERHRLATGIVVTEALLNLISNILLLNRFGFTVVLWNSLILKILFSAFPILPVLFRALRISAMDFFREVLMKPFLAGIPMLAWLIFQQYIHPENAWGQVLFGGLPAGLLYLAGMLYFLPGNQRKRYLRKLTAYLESLRGRIKKRSFGT